MRGTRVGGAGSIARVWRAEGLAAVRDRVWDRVRDASIRARCARGGRGPWPSASILNVIGVPMTTTYGGVPVQLRARLRHESMARPVAVLSREPGLSSGPGGAGASWRLEAWSDGRPRRAMTFPAGDWDGDALRDDPAWLHAVRTCVRLVDARAIHIENAAGLSLVSLLALMAGGSSGSGSTGLGGNSGTFEATYPGDPSKLTSGAITRASGGPARSGAAPLDVDVSGSAASASADGPRVPVVLSIHDLALFSRDPQPLVADASSHEAPESPGSPETRKPPVDDDRRRLEHAFHHALGTGIVRAAAFTIYPSRFMRDDVEALPHLPAHIVAPGIELPARAMRSARRPDQIALLGGGQTHKGGPRLARIAAALAARGLCVTSYGGYGHEHLLQMRGARGVRVRGYYRAGSLPGLLAHQGASVALILSAFAESFSLVLSEAWAAGVPVIAPALGAFPERLGTAGGSGGLLISANPTEEEILNAIDRARSMQWDALPTPPTAAQAAERHLALYRDAGFIAGSASS